MKKQLIQILRRMNHFLIPTLVIYFVILILKLVELYDFIIAFILAFQPLLYGLLIALFLQPLVEKTERRIKKKYAVYLVYGSIFLIMLLSLIMIVPMLLNGTSSIFTTSNTWLKDIEAIIEQIDAYHLISDEFKRQLFANSTGIGVNFMMKGAKVLTITAFSFVIAFFISMDFDHAVNGFKKYVVNHEQWLNFYQTVSNVILKYLVGTIIDLTLIFISVSLILIFFDFPNALFYALLLAFLNLFPYIGATLGVLIIAFVSYFIYPEFPFLCILLVWLFQQAEANIIQPLIFNKAMDVPPLYLFSAMFIGEAMFGVFGLILSPILAAIIQIGLRSYFHTLNTHTIGGWEDIFW